MPRFVAVQGGGQAIHMPPDFADQAEAQAYMAGFDIPGLATLQSAWDITPLAVAVELEVAIEAKQRELVTEGDRRSVLVDVHYQSVLQGFVLGLTINAVTALGGQWVAVAVAWDDARQVVEALPDLAAVAAYDVVTDPAWP